MKKIRYFVLVRAFKVDGQSSESFVGDPDGYETKTIPVMLATELSKPSGVDVFIEEHGDDGHCYSHVCGRCKITCYCPVLFAEWYQNGSKDKPKISRNLKKSA